MKSRRMSQAAAHFEERRQREHGAPRLRDRVPSLATLRFDIVEDRGSLNANPKHTRFIMVETGPALFELACTDPSCRDGGHDLTSAVILGLLEGKSRFEVDRQCRGSVGSVECGRHVHIDVTATYRAMPDS